MYLLPASDRYISIALYMPILGGILLGPLLYAVTVWMETFGLDLEHERQSKEVLLLTIAATGGVGSGISPL